MIPFQMHMKMSLLLNWIREAIMQTNIIKEMKILMIVKRKNLTKRNGKAEIWWSKMIELSELFRNALIILSGRVF